MHRKIKVKSKGSLSAHLFKHAALALIILVLFSSCKSEVENNMVFPVGIRLSNPGNIKKDKHSHWEGMTRLQDDAKFVRFRDPYNGLRAIAKLLITYKKAYHCDSITEIINRYAPPSENNTFSYIRDVSARSGFFPNELLDMGDTMTLVRILQAIVVHENGIALVTFPPAWYEESLYIKAVEDALEED